MKRVDPAWNALVAVALAFLPASQAGASAMQRMRDRDVLRQRVRQADASPMIDQWPTGCRQLLEQCRDVADCQAATLPAKAISEALDWPWPHPAARCWQQRRDLCDDVGEAA